MFNRKLCFICFASHSMTNYIRHHVFWTTLISGWKLYFFHSFFTFGATKINTVTFSRFIYIIFYRKCQNYLCFIFLLKFDIMFLKKIPISILFHLELFFKIQLLWIFTSFFVVENLLWFKLFNVWMILSNWQLFRIVSANQSDEGEQYVPGYNGGSKGGRSSGMLRAHFLYI